MRRSGLFGVSYLRGFFSSLFLDLFPPRFMTTEISVSVESKTLSAKVGKTLSICFYCRRCSAPTCTC